jgi:hypothetical protein
MGEGGKMISGSCHLCGEQKLLKDSHVWSKLAYRRYITNPGEGGKFVDLQEGRLSNRQYTRYWFCEVCEGILGKSEDYAARFLDRMAKDPKKEHPYDERLLPFIVSISWRSLKFHTPGDHPRGVEGQWDAARAWRRYLLGEGGIKSYTQHVFNIIDNPFGLDKMLGGALISKAGLVISQIGPLIIVGILEPEKLTPEERAVWGNSQVRPLGGVIKPLVEWRTWRHGKGQAHRHTITRRFTLLLKSFEVSTIVRTIATVENIGR